jgi:hypothetical protein
MNKLFNLVLFLFAIIVLVSCKKSDDNNVSPAFGTSNFPTDEGKDTIWVSNVAELMATVNSTKEGNKVVLIKNGVYEVDDRLWLTGDNLIYRSESEDRSKVVIKGKGMASDEVGFIFSVLGDNFAVKDITIGEVYYHGIQVHGEADADNVYIQNVRFYDIRQQMIKGSYSSDQPTNFSENCVVEGCLFEYTAGQSYYFYCGGVDVHHGLNWKISYCTFKNIYSPENALSEGAIHFWSNSEGTISENNTIINCDRGIMYGLDGSPHLGGVIRNNMIHVTRDVGVYLCYAKDAKVYNNTVFTDVDYPNSIEYRFEQTSNCDIVNNLTNKAIASRNNADANVENNVTIALADWFVNASAANLHLNKNIESVVDKAIDLEEITIDFDGDNRPTGASDVGADEI